MGDDAWQDKVMQANAGFDLDYLFQDGRPTKLAGQCKVRRGRAGQGREEGNGSWGGDCEIEVVRGPWAAVGGN